MQKLDIEFFEAYKHLDRLCSDMYRCRNGVTQYIEDMETQAYYGQFAVPNWDAAYKTLKHLRWVRNQIAHGEGQHQICEERDLRDVTGFYDDIISGRDPLTKLRKYRKACVPLKKPVACAEFQIAPTASRRHKAPSTAGRTFGLTAIIMTVLVVLAYIVVHFQ